MTERNQSGQFQKGHTTNVGKARKRPETPKQAMTTLGQENVEAMLFKIFWQAMDDDSDKQAASQKLLMDRCYPIASAQMETIRAEFEDIKDEMEETYAQLQGN